MVAVGPSEHHDFVLDLTGGKRGNVVGTIRHRGDEPASGLFTFFVGYVLPDALGLGHVCRNDWLVPDFDVLVCAIPAGHFDLRNAGIGGTNVG